MKESDKLHSKYLEFVERHGLSKGLLKDEIFLSLVDKIDPKEFESSLDKLTNNSSTKEVEKLLSQYTINDLLSLPSNKICERIINNNISAMEEKEGKIDAKAHAAFSLLSNSLDQISYGGKTGLLCDRKFLTALINSGRIEEFASEPETLEVFATAAVLNQQLYEFSKEFGVSTKYCKNNSDLIKEFEHTPEEEARIIQQTFLLPRIRSGIKEYSQEKFVSLLKVSENPQNILDALLEIEDNNNNKVVTHLVVDKIKEYEKNLGKVSSEEKKGNDEEGQSFQEKEKNKKDKKDKNCIIF